MASFWAILQCGILEILNKQTAIKTDRDDGLWELRGRERRAGRVKRTFIVVQLFCLIIRSYIVIYSNATVWVIMCDVSSHRLGNDVWCQFTLISSVLVDVDTREGCVWGKEAHESPFPFLPSLPLSLLHMFSSPFHSLPLPSSSLYFPLPSILLVSLDHSKVYPH